MTRKYGISILALVVTVIVIGILGTAIVYTLVNANTMDDAQRAKQTTNEKIIQEKIDIIESSYMMAYGMEELPTATKNELKELSQITDVDISKFTVYYDKLYRRDYIFYRLEKVTLEEAQKIEAIQEDGRIKYYFLIFDTNLDGVLTKKDLQLAISMQQNNIHNFMVDYIISPDSYVAYNSETQKVEQPSSNISLSNNLFSEAIDFGGICYSIDRFISDISAEDYHKESKSGTAYYTFANQYADQIETYNEENSGT